MIGGNISSTKCFLNKVTVNIYITIPTIMDKATPFVPPLFKVTAPKILNGRNTKEDRRINQFSLENFGYDIDKLRSLLLKKVITPRIKSNKL